MFSAILCCLLFADTPRAPAAPQAIPLERGQEIVWKGTYKEEVIHPGVTGTRSYTVETALFVLETHAAGADAAIVTVLKLQPGKDAKGGPVAGVARLVLARIDREGRIGQLPAESLADSPEARLGRKAIPFEPAPLAALPVPELGMLPPLPEGWQTLGTWDMPELGRPSKHWKNEGGDTYRSARCTRLNADQRSADWEHPGRPNGWRVTETAWISSIHGYAVKFDRVTERKNAGTGEIEYRATLKCEMAGQLRYSYRAYDERREEISTAAGLAEEVEKMLPAVGRTGPAPFVRLLARIDYYTQTQRPLGESLIYREALNAAKRKAEAAMHGHVAPEATAWTEKPTRTMVPDRLLADFAGENANGTTRETWQLGRAKGKPVLLLYYQPHAASAVAVLQAGQQLQREFGRGATVVGMAIGDMEAARKQAAELKVDLPILNAGELRKLHGVQSTPTMAVVDADGVVRRIAVGWGEESVGLLREELGKHAR